jgi:uncharacterized damage-inducible protein DinB
MHLVAAQQSYLNTFTLPLEDRRTAPSVAFEDVRQSVTASGEGLLALARDPSRIPTVQLQTRHGYCVAPWVLMVQAINHATEHREQINSMLSALGVTPPDLDGWTYGEVTHALIPIAT